MAKFSIIISFSLWLVMAWHPFHVSVCEIHYDEKDKALQITQKIFIDDLESGLMKDQSERFDITESANKSRFDKIIKPYFLEKVRIIINGNQVTPQFLGYEFEGDAIWCYAEVGNVGTLQSIKITNRILFDTFSDQSNIVHIEKGDSIKSFKLVDHEDSGQVTY